MPSGAIAHEQANEGWPGEAWSACGWLKPWSAFLKQVLAAAEELPDHREWYLCSISESTCLWRETVLPCGAQADDGKRAHLAI